MSWICCDCWDLLNEGEVHVCAAVSQDDDGYEQRLLGMTW